MTEQIALFPLGTVLFPGLVLPLHVFEPRYRHLVQDLLAAPEPRRFGIVAIRKGSETGVDGVEALYDVGCTATLAEVESLDDGRFNLLTVGTSRFRLHALDNSLPYFRGDVELLDESTGDESECALLVQAVHAAFNEYVTTLLEKTGSQIELTELPDDPTILSYVVAAAIVVDMSDKQALLAEPDALRRLAAERALLTREVAMLRALTAAPAPDLTRTPYSPN